MSNDMYNTFYDTPIHYGHDSEYEHTQREAETEPTYVLDYGDTAKIPFHISDDFKTDLLFLNVYNFRYELVYQLKQFVDDDQNIYLTIDKDTSADIFKRGIYYCGIQAVEVILTDDSDDYEYGNNVTTIMHPNDCMINVR